MKSSSRRTAKAHPTKREIFKSRAEKDEWRKTVWEDVNSIQTMFFQFPCSCWHFLSRILWCAESFWELLDVFPLHGESIPRKKLIDTPIQMVYNPPNLNEVQIFLIQVLLHLLLYKLLAKFKVSNEKHLVEEPIEIVLRHLRWNGKLNFGVFNKNKPS